MQPHRMDALIPTVEITDDADSPRIGRPDREGDARDTLHRAQMCAEPLIEIEVAAFANQVEIEVAEERGQRVGIDHALNAPIFPLDIELIALVRFPLAARR